MSSSQADLSNNASDRSGASPGSGLPAAPCVPGRMAVVAVAALMGGGQYGFTLAIVAGAEPFLVEQFGLSSQQLGLVVSNLDLGAALGALLAGPLSDRFGRKKVLLATALVFLLSALLTAMATSVGVLLVGRALAGMAVGAAMIVPMYVAEISSAQVRGLLVSLVQIGIVSGILIAFCTGWVAADTGPMNWRWMFGAGIVPAAILAAVTISLPESPRWLASQSADPLATGPEGTAGRPNQAQLVLQTSKERERTKSSDWRELLKPGVRKPLLIGVVLAILSVSVGINAVILYGPMILIQGAGQDASAALLGAVALGGVNFLFSLVAMVTIDRIGRKPLLLCGFVGMGLSMFLLGLRFHLGTAESTPALLVPILAFIAFYAVSLGPVTWVLVSEIFPTSTRGAGMSLCMVVMYLADFIVTFAFPWMMGTLGSVGFHMFAAVCGGGILFVCTCVPETKGKSLEQIESMWSIREPGVP